MGDPERLEAIARPSATPMSANLETPRVLGLALKSASGVTDSTQESTATSQSDDDVVFKEARAARTYRTDAGPSIVRSLGIRTLRSRLVDEIEVYHWLCA